MSVMVTEVAVTIGVSLRTGADGSVSGDKKDKLIPPDHLLTQTGCLPTLQSESGSSTGWFVVGHSTHVYSQHPPYHSQSVCVLCNHWVI